MVFGVGLVCGLLTAWDDDMLETTWRLAQAVFLTS